MLLYLFYRNFISSGAISRIGKENGAGFIMRISGAQLRIGGAPWAKYSFNCQTSGLQILELMIDNKTS